jgi:hypothetical protein
VLIAGDVLAGAVAVWIFVVFPPGRSWHGDQPLGRWRGGAMGFRRKEPMTLQASCSGVHVERTPSDARAIVGKAPGPVEVDRGRRAR